MHYLIHIVNFVTMVQSRKFSRIVKVAKTYQTLQSVRNDSGAHHPHYPTGYVRCFSGTKKSAAFLSSNLKKCGALPTVPPTLFHHGILFRHKVILLLHVTNLFPGFDTS
jgi:hypothetical protein